MKWWPKASMRLADTVGWYYRRVLLGTIICSDFAGLAAEVFSRRQRQCDQARAAAGSGARVPGANRRRLQPPDRTGRSRRDRRRWAHFPLHWRMMRVSIRALTHSHVPMAHGG